MRPDIDCYRANYNYEAWKIHAALTGNDNCAPIAAALAVTALCDAYESLEAVLAESRANDMASMRLVADCRFAVGDDGKRMFPEFVEFLKELKKQRDELLSWKESNRRHAQMGKAIEYAAEKLPFGFDLAVEVEKDAGGIRLWNEDGDEVEIDDGDYLHETIYNAVNIAESIAGTKGSAS